ncbi:MAG TPA: hypothetical protein VES20_12045 [Bryobacteraceae bacterium]|nr:hypothetical protein [Bryobacteraceae bacterium]
MRTAIIAPDGVGIRNFALSGFLEKLDGEVLILHSSEGPVLDALKRRTAGKAEWAALAPQRESPVPFTLRQMLSYAHVYWADTHSMRYTRSRKTRGSWRTVAANRTARAVGRMAAFPGGVRAIESAYFWSASTLPEVRGYQDVLRAFRPSVVLSTSQQAPRVLAPVLAARSLGMRTVTFVASWDNLTSKGRIAAPFDHYLVWSEHMKGELLRFYPHVAAERVHVTGTPQFDCYADEELRWTREEFCRRVGADPARPLICYSGGDEGTCPDDQHHVRILMSQVRSGAIKGDPQVLLRPSPVDPCTRYQSVRQDYPELLVAEPEWQKSTGLWSAFVPKPEDVQFLANLTRHSDVNENVA